MKSHRALFVVVFSWIVFFSGIRTIQHFSFGTNACDLSLFDYGMYYTLKGELMADPFHQFGLGRWERDDGTLHFQPERGRRWESHFAVHFTPIIFALVPLYLIWDGPLFLLYLQVIFVGLSAVPLYFIARRLFAEKRLSIVIVLTYLFYRQLLIGLMHDIHMEMYFPLLLFSSYYFIAVKRRPAPYFFFLSLALLIKEDIAVYTLFLGVFIFLKLGERRIGLVTSLYSLAYLVVAMEIVIPHFRNLEGMRDAYVYGHLGEGLPEMVTGLLSDPRLLLEGIDVNFFLRKLGNILLPLLLLPLFSSYVFLTFPPVLVALMSKNPQHYSFGIHYSATLLPFVFLALVYGLKRVKDSLGRRAVHRRNRIAAAIPLLLLSINLANSEIWVILRPSRYEALQSYARVKRVIDDIPAGASIAALSSLIPHIPKRTNIYMLPEANAAEYVLVHSGVNLWPYTEEEFSRFLGTMDRDARYSLSYHEGDVMLFKRVD